jgi:hypothetical protein
MTSSQAQRCEGVARNSALIAAAMIADRNTINPRQSYTSVESAWRNKMRNSHQHVQSYFRVRHRRVHHAKDHFVTDHYVTYAGHHHISTDNIKLRQLSPCALCQATEAEIQSCRHRFSYNKEDSAECDRTGH